jgi:putative SOS response-associated peptidase YedK
MCGRFTLCTNAEALAERFGALLPVEAVAPTYNAAPSQAQLVIRNDTPQTISRAAWGFVPEWAAGRPDVEPQINARGESVAEKPFFRDAFKKKRCLVVADGSYEWWRTTEGKRPYRIALKTEEPFAFAGIWSSVGGVDGKPHTTFAILTTDANELVAQMHTRMPVILRPEDEEHWLGKELAPEKVREILVPYPAALLTAHAVSPKVNAPAYNTPEALRPV